ncbi:hypothetical protein FQN55_003238 [Onygenales sp. PD_40]|nr:hypothetical protein FQN55_003238 [Onygenales sp. PD_40]KAK2769474.1 hypothetical protein FQN53_006160 [Emmonsiellopsis sp. PD_33]
MSQISSESEDEAAIESAQLAARFILKQLSERHEETAEQMLRSVKDELVAIS